MKVPAYKHYTKRYSDLKPHELRTPVRILRIDEESLDDEGLPCPKEIVLIDTRGYVEVSTVDETSDSMGRLNINRVRCVIRFPMRIQVMEKDILEVQGVRYNIISVNDVNFVHALLELQAEVNIVSER